MTGPLDRPEDEIVMDQDLVEAFYGLDELSLAVHATGFTLMEEMNRLQKIIRDPDPRISIQGLRHFRSLMREIGTVSGRLAVAREKRIETDGREVTIREVESGVQLQKRLAHRDTDRKFPISERRPTDASDSRDAEDVAGVDGAASGPDAGSAEPSGHGRGGSGDAGDSRLREALGRGREPEAAVPEPDPVVHEETPSPPRPASGGSLHGPSGGSDHSD